jgi:hypothetical protein
MIRCSKCILPDTYPNIEFDDRGECNFCKEHVSIKYLGSEKLREDLSEYRKENVQYDCLVPVSGGKDSAFVLYQVSKVYNMKVLAFNYDNGVTHHRAQKNVREIAASLGVDLVVRKNEKQKKYLATNLKAYIRKPSIGMIPMLCTGCRYGIIGNAFKTAREYSIPMIVIGWSPIEDTPFKESYLLNGNSSVKSGLIRNLMKNPSYVRPGNMLAAVKDYYHNYQHVKDWNVVLKMLHPGVKLIQFYDYIPYNPDEIQRVVEEEVDWKTPDKIDTWQWDCKIKLLQNYFYDQAAKFTATDCYLSAMIREGYITRSEAARRLAYIKQNQKDKLYYLHEFLKEVDAEGLISYFM